MNQTLMAEIDTFTEQNDLLDLYEKYESELDAEIRQDEFTLARYFMYRENGQSPRFAAIAACQRAPGTKGSDRAFNEHARRRMDRMHATNQERILGIAKRAGINTQGKYYVGGLGRYNDPAAWVSTTDDILSVAKARNLNVEGSVNHTATPVGPPKKVRLAEDLIEDQMAHYLQDPREREKAKKTGGLAALRDKVIEKHGAPKES